jgi:hypothetical protein
VNEHAKDWGEEPEPGATEGTREVKCQICRCIVRLTFCYQSCALRAGTSLSSRLSSFAPSKRGVKWSAARIARLPLGHGGNNDAKWHSNGKLIRAMQSCVTHGTNFHDPIVTGKQGEATIGSRRLSDGPNVRAPALMIGQFGSSHTFGPFGESFSSYFS